MRFVIFVIDGDVNTAATNEMAAIDQFNQMLQDNGHFIYAAGIAKPADAVLIDNRSDANLTSAGSLFSDQQFYSGFWLINAASHEEATVLAKAGSKACNRRVELRGFLGQ
ncbi:MAG: hypothetical protein RIS08_503 [Actinomycetota bacterium]|jgi:hypothetical protein